MITFSTLCQGSSGISTSLSCTSFMYMHTQLRPAPGILARILKATSQVNAPCQYILSNWGLCSTPPPPSPVDHLRSTAMWLPFVPGGTYWPGPAIPWVCKLSLWEEGLYPPAQVVVSPDSDYGPGGNEWQRTQILRKANDILQGICFRWGLCTVSTLGEGLLLLARRV